MTNGGESREQKRAALLVFAFACVCVYGWWTNFVPSDAWRLQSIGVAIVAAGIASLCLYRQSATARAVAAAPRPAWKLTDPVYFVPLLLTGCFWVLFTYTLPDLVTMAIGSAHYETAPLFRQKVTARRGCRYQVGGPALDHTFNGYFCVPPSFYDALPDTPTPLVLIGKQTRFGFRIERIMVN